MEQKVFQSTSFKDFKVVFDGYATLSFFIDGEERALLIEETYELGLALQNYLGKVGRPLPSEETNLRKAIGQATPSDVGEVFKQLPNAVRYNVQEIVRGRYGDNVAKAVRSLLDFVESQE